MRSLMVEILVLSGVSLLSFGSIADAVGPAQADFDICNREAHAQAASPSAAPGTGAGRITDSTSPGTQATAGASPLGSSTGNPVTPGNPTGGRITDSTQPGVPAPAAGVSGASSASDDLSHGMAAAGQADPAFRH